MSKELEYLPKDTPRTNAVQVVIDRPGSSDKLDWISFARQLERELAAKSPEFTAPQMTEAAWLFHVAHAPTNASRQFREALYEKFDLKVSTGLAAKSTPASDGVEYDPVTCLREEVERFRATNRFTPMLVTGFYIQAGLVLAELDRTRAATAALRQGLEQAQEQIKNQVNNFTLISDQVGGDATPNSVDDILQRIREQAQELEQAKEIIADYSDDCAMMDSLRAELQLARESATDHCRRAEAAVADNCRTIARLEGDKKRLDWLELNGVLALRDADNRYAHVKIRDVIDAALNEPEAKP